MSTKSVKEEIAELRERLDTLESKVSDPLPDYVRVGKVVRFNKKFGGQTYTYVALKAKMHTWYLTGTVSVDRKLSDSKFREFLADATKIEIATEWEPLDA